LLVHCDSNQWSWRPNSTCLWPGAEFHDALNNTLLDGTFREISNWLPSDFMSALVREAGPFAGLAEPATQCEN
jgi:hypothetical protein